MEQKELFERLNSLNVNDKTEKKGNLTYLSWAWAWAEFKKACPDATYEVVKFDGLPYAHDQKTGYMVYTKVTACGVTHEMWLPVMDSRNRAMLEPTMFDVNKTIMRCLTKNLAMFGLGLYIYAGEDLPEGEEHVPTCDSCGKPIEPITDDKGRSWSAQQVYDLLVKRDGVARCAECRKLYGGLKNGN